MKMMYKLTDLNDNTIRINSHEVDGFDGNGNLIVNGSILKVKETKMEIEKQFSDWFKQLIKKGYE